MKIVIKEEFEMQKPMFLDRILKGAVYIHPTDTIYGIGCSAKHSRAVNKIRAIKERTNMPFSVIAPSKDWIFENCIVSMDAEKWINKLPGPYTLIFRLKNGNAIAPEVNSGMNTLGVRIPLHWVSSIARELNIPLVTTSANVSGKEYMVNLDTLDPDIKKKMDFVIYEGEKSGKPSTVVHLDKEEEKVVER